MLTLSQMTNVDTTQLKEFADDNLDFMKMLESSPEG